MPAPRIDEPAHGLGPRFVRRRIALETGHFSYLARGGAEPALMLIPGSFNDSHAVKEIIDQLDGKMQLVVVELRGHGDSWPPPKNCSIEQLALDLLRVVDEMELASCYIGGHSIGGMVALEAARVRPGNVRGVISIEGWTSHDALADAFEGHTTNTLSSDQITRNSELRTRVLRRWTEEQMEEWRTYWRQWDGYGFLCRTDLPILELYGDRGRARPSLDQLRVPARANIRVQWIENASHNLQIEAPGEVARACTDFINRVERAGS